MRFSRLSVPFHTTLLSASLHAAAILLMPLRVGAQTTVTISSAMPPAAPRIQGALTVGVFPATPLLHTIATTGQNPIAFSATGLPPGLALDAASGRISGSVATAGRYDAKVTASNSFGTDERAVTIVVGDTIALTPPLGWNSYDSFDDSVTEAEVLAQATWVRDNLLAYGWQYVVVDFRWYDPNAPQSNQNGNNPDLVIDANGRFLPAPDRFPNGFAKLAQDIHAMGLKFGIHIMRGIPRKSHAANTPIANSTATAQQAADTAKICRWNSDNYGVRGSSAEGQAWYDSIFSLYASWGVDFVKVDDITSNPGATNYWADEVEAIHRAIQKCGRSMVLSLSPGETPVSQATHLVANANMWRMSDDFWDRPADLTHMFDLASRWQGVAGPPGHWPDADMLPVGHLGPRCPVDGVNRDTRFTRNEQVAMLTLWAVLPSPLMIGTNLAQTTDSFTKDLLTNEEVLSVSQDGLGARAKRVVAQANQQVWVKDLSANRKAVALFNRGSTDQRVSATPAQIGVSGRHRVRDVWRRMDAPSSDQGLDVLVPGLAGLLYVLTPDGPTDAGVGDADGSPGRDGAAGQAGAGGQAGMSGAGGQGGAGGASGAAGQGGGIEDSGVDAGGDRRPDAAGGGSGAAGTAGSGGAARDAGPDGWGGAAGSAGGAMAGTGGVAGTTGGSTGVTGSGSPPNASSCACTLGVASPSFGAEVGAALTAFALQRRRRRLRLANNAGDQA